YYCSIVISFFFSSRRRHTRFSRDWSSDVCSSDLHTNKQLEFQAALHTRIGNKISVNGGFSLATMKNLYFFRNDSLDVSRFVLERSEERRVGKECRYGWWPEN